MAEVLGDEDRVAALRPRREADRTDRGQAGVLEVAQDPVLALGDLAGELLEGVDEALEDEEPDEVPRRPDRQLAEPVARVAPAAQRPLPGQVEQVRLLGQALLRPGELVAEARRVPGIEVGKLDVEAVLARRDEVVERAEKAEFPKGMQVVLETPWDITVAGGNVTAALDRAALEAAPK